MPSPRRWCAVGRTHQIRVHTQYAGHPIAFDDRYGDREFNQQLPKREPVLNVLSGTPRGVEVHASGNGRSHAH